MSRIILKPLKSRKQLRAVEFETVLTAGFTDDTEKFFTITFDLQNGTRQDLTISFETRTPKVYFSEPYKE